MNIRQLNEQVSQALQAIENKKLLLEDKKILAFKGNIKDVITTLKDLAKAFGDNISINEVIKKLKNDLKEDKNGIVFNGKKQDIQALLRDLTDQYGNLTIPEFIDKLIQAEKDGQEVIREALNEKYDEYITHDEITALLQPLIKTNYKNLIVKVGKHYLDIKTKNGEKLESRLAMMFFPKSEQANSWMAELGPTSVYLQNRSDELFKACLSVFPDYKERGWDVTFYTNRTLARRNKAGHQQAAEEIANELNTILSKIDAIIDSKNDEVDKELEQLEKARSAAKANKNAKNTTVKQALSKTAIIKKIQALQDVTPERLAKILAAIED